LETFTAALSRRLPAKVNTTLLEKQEEAVTGGLQDETESALCETTLQGLRELGSDVGASFFPQLLETFEHDAVEHLAALRSAIAGGQTGLLRGEAHALNGASLTIGAQDMADIFQQLGGVKNEIEQESLIP
jgi:Hpt domain